MTVVCPQVYGVTLLILCSSPGGSYSNWWCSVFNADLALSVAMTTTSTFFAMVMLPLNTLMYVNFAYGSTGEESDGIDLNWVRCVPSSGCWLAEVVRNLGSLGSITSAGKLLCRLWTICWVPVPFLSKLFQFNGPGCRHLLDGDISTYQFQETSNLG